jgi:AhpD family alkylhydroperoxidase
MAISSCMTDFKRHDLDSAPTASRPVLAATQKAWGFLPTLHATLAESPVALEAYTTLFDLVAKGTLSPAAQQVAFLTVAAFHGCGYCTMGHTFLARKAGLDEDHVQALRANRPLADARLEALRGFTLAVVRERGHAGDAAVDAFLAAGYTRAQVLEVVVVIATKTISNYANHLTHVPLESFMSDPALAWVAPAREAGR